MFIEALFTIPTHAVVTLSEMDPTSGEVGTEVRLIGTIDSRGGPYTIWFDIDDDGTAVGDTVVKTGNTPANSYAVNDTFVVPSCVGTDAGREHKVTLQDTSSENLYDAIFTVQTSNEIVVPSSGMPVISTASWGQTKKTGPPYAPKNWASFRATTRSISK